MGGYFSFWIDEEESEGGVVVCIALHGVIGHLWLWTENKGPRNHT